MVLNHFFNKAEERVHDVMLGNIDYQINFNNTYSSFITYLSSQQTQRDHYTGIRPDIGSVDDEIICLTLLTEHL